MASAGPAGSKKDVYKRQVHDFMCGRIYAGAKRLMVKEYPADAAEALKKAGFQKEMQDYVYYW